MISFLRVSYNNCMVENLHLKGGRHAFLSTTTWLLREFNIVLIYSSNRRFERSGLRQ